MTSVNQNLKHLLDRPVDRREFLVLAGSAVFAVVGFTRILDLLAGHKAHSSSGDGGWGHTAYGGPDR